jgi:hypothetical protein
MNYEEIKSTIQQSYTNFLVYLGLDSRNSEEKQFFDHVNEVGLEDLNNLNLFVHAYARKLKDISFYISEKRNEQRFYSIKKDIVHTSLGLEKLFYSYILTSFTKRLENPKNLAIVVQESEIQNFLPVLDDLNKNIKIEIEELYGNFDYTNPSAYTDTELGNLSLAISILINNIVDKKSYEEPYEEFEFDNQLPVIVVPTPTPTPTPTPIVNIPFESGFILMQGGEYVLKQDDGKIPIYTFSLTDPFSATGPIILESSTRYGNNENDQTVIEFSNEQAIDIDIEFLAKDCNYVITNSCPLNVYIDGTLSYSLSSGGTPSGANLLYTISESFAMGDHVIKFNYNINEQIKTKVTLTKTGGTGVFNKISARSVTKKDVGMQLVIRGLTSNSNISVRYKDGETGVVPYNNSNYIFNLSAVPMPSNPYTFNVNGVSTLSLYAQNAQSTTGKISQIEVINDGDSFDTDNYSTTAVYGLSVGTTSNNSSSITWVTPYTRGEAGSSLTKAFNVNNFTIRADVSTQTSGSTGGLAVSPTTGVYYITNVSDLNAYSTFDGSTGTFGSIIKRFTTTNMGSPALNCSVSESGGSTPPPVDWDNVFIPHENLLY